MFTKLAITIRFMIIFSLFCFGQNVVADVSVASTANSENAVSKTVITKSKKAKKTKKSKKTKIVKRAKIAKKTHKAAKVVEANKDKITTETIKSPEPIKAVEEAVVQPVTQLQPQSIIQPRPTANVARTPSFIPAPPDFDAKAYILIDANTGYVIAEKNADQHLGPASITKIMSLYVIAEALRTGKTHFTDQVTISENAWRSSFGGSRMFVKVGSVVSVRDLISGIATVSGNDASIAMAEYLSGTESGFVSLMNQTAKNLGMNNTNFTDSYGGMPNINHYSTARDLAFLSSKWIANFPEYYSWFKEKWFTHNGIKQPNRNNLLWRDPSVDGIKTGHANADGYCLIASAVRNNGMRLISVILGARSAELRTKYSEALLNYGYHFFETQKLFAANASLVTPRVWLGKEKIAVLGLKNDMYVTLPIGQHSGLKAKAEVSSHLKAPIIQGQPYGTFNIMLNGKIISSQPLIALKTNNRTNFIFALYDYALLLFQQE